MFFEDGHIELDDYDLAVAKEEAKYYDMLPPLTRAAIQGAAGHINGMQQLYRMWQGGRSDAELAVVVKELDDGWVRETGTLYK